ncbi:hypothetical protein AAFC00_005110 [Neodothiora populina]|uniref:Sld7 C-terminal domain-containing protein n=1 Tax=Neodothiora populina TaxID=2781224 RepID=A0ABR3PJT7_9PEZI
MEVWKGDLIISSNHSVTDIHFSTPETSKPSGSLLPPGSQLRFLAFVDPSRIPLAVIHGPVIDVWTQNESTEDWFSKTFFDSAGTDEDAEWWHTAGPESPLGVLAAVINPIDVSLSLKQPRITEVLFVASSNASPLSCPPTPPRSSQGARDAGDGTTSFRLHALTLSSDLLYKRLEQIPIATPRSPSAIDDGPTDNATAISATYLPDSFSSVENNQKANAKLSTSATSTSLKRKSINDTFTEADALRKRMRSTPGESVQAASATGPSMPSLRELTSHALESRSASYPSTRPFTSSHGGTVPMQTRPLSRSSSVNRPTTSLSKSSVASTTQAEPSKRSGLARVQSVPAALESSKSSSLLNADIETKNKDLVSRLVMAGMRLYGLSQSKSKKSQQQQLQQLQQKPPQPSPGNPNHTIASSSLPAATTTLQPQDPQQSRKDEEYKLIYHTTYKGALFALRAHLSSQPLQHPHTTELVRQVVDKLLAIYCHDPLASAAIDDDGGGGQERSARKAFVTPREEDGSPFAGATVLDPKGKGAGAAGEGDLDVFTPSLRKRGQAPVG